MKGSEARGDSVRPGAGAPAADPESDLAGALHEVSNALTVVLGWLEAAEADTPPGPAKSALDVARVHARQGYSIARRAIGAEAIGEAAERSARTLAEDAALGVAQEAARRGVTPVFASSASSEVMLENAPTALQILTNLLLNAIAMSAAGARVTLDARRDDTGAIFCVTDEGPGIDPARAELLFTGAPSTRRGGAGIGLRHSHALAVSKGAEVSLGWSELGRGSRFELRWPASEVRSSARHRHVSRASVAGLRLLVVEDDPAVLALIELALEGRGARVTRATSDAELARVCDRGEHFDAALLDLSPIGGDLSGAVSRLRVASPRLPVVVISGTAVDVPTLPETGPLLWVRKPFEMGEILDALADATADATAAVRDAP